MWIWPFNLLRRRAPRVRQSRILPMDEREAELLRRHRATQEIHEADQK